MAKFYKITPEEAYSLGYKKHDANNHTNPFCSEQEDGCFLINEKEVKRNENNPNYSNVDFNSKSTINEEGIQTAPDAVNILNENELNP